MFLGRVAHCQSGTNNSSDRHCLAAAGTILDLSFADVFLLRSRRELVCRWDCRLSMGLDILRMCDMSCLVCFSYIRGMDWSELTQHPALVHPNSHSLPPLAPEAPLDLWLQRLQRADGLTSRNAGSVAGLPISPHRRTSEITSPLWMTSGLTSKCGVTNFNILCCGKLRPCFSTVRWPRRLVLKTSCFARELGHKTSKNSTSSPHVDRAYHITALASADMTVGRFRAFAVHIYVKGNIPRAEYASYSSTYAVMRRGTREKKVVSTSKALTLVPSCRVPPRGC